MGSHTPAPGESRTSGWHRALAAGRQDGDVEAPGDQGSPSADRRACQPKPLRTRKRLRLSPWLRNDELLERRAILVRVLNRSRNEAKHANDPTETSFEVEQMRPLQMIMRTIPMCASLGGKPSGNVPR